MISIMLVLLIGCLFVGRAVYSALRVVATPGNKEYIKFIGYSLLAVGGFGFFATMLSAMGGLGRLPAFDWPAGNVRGVLVMPDGERVVPLKAPGRIQVYDSDWRFLRGWHANAGGGTFTLRLNGTNRIEVFTARRQQRYVYSLDGELLSQETYAPQRYSDFYVPGKSASVPTRWWMWMLTSPFYSWIVGAFGGGLVFLCSWKAKKRQELP
jgi:hypothetical protein